jgi:hypothetical protein
VVADLASDNENQLTAATGAASAAVSWHRVFLKKPFCLIQSSGKTKGGWGLALRGGAPQSGQPFNCAPTATAKEGDREGWTNRTDGHTLLARLLRIIIHKMVKDQTLCPI